MKTDKPQLPAPAHAASEIADAIVKISKAIEEVSNTRLRRKALVALIHDQSKLPKKTIEIVLNNLADLEKDWLKPAA